MTLCIAAACQYRGEPPIVVCSDWKGDAGYTGSETFEKQVQLVPGWLAMCAGKQPRITELLIAYRDHLMANPVKPRDVVRSLKEPVDAQRLRIMNERIQAKIGKSYEWLLAEGATSLGTDYAIQLIQSLEDTTLGAHLILCGFVKDADWASITVLKKNTLM